MQENDCKQDSQNRAGFIDRHNLIDIADLQRTEITQPACAGCKAGQYQEQKRFFADCGKPFLRADA